mmetsp:Transcript_7754/g.16993  ORF Transcript_7754/g.16993 Transcript_7754/m.16993 type:complete len:255 (-) Transcript_7754:137-901(-)
MDDVPRRPVILRRHGRVFPIVPFLSNVAAAGIIIAVVVVVIVGTPSTPLQTRPHNRRALDAPPMRPRLVERPARKGRVAGAQSQPLCRQRRRHVDDALGGEGFGAGQGEGNAGQGDQSAEVRFGRGSGTGGFGEGTVGRRGAERRAEEGARGFGEGGGIGGKSEGSVRLVLVGGVLDDVIDEVDDGGGNGHGAVSFDGRADAVDSSLGHCLSQQRQTGDGGRRRQELVGRRSVVVVVVERIKRVPSPLPTIADF